jgi:hypothetical protein
VGGLHGVPQGLASVDFVVCSSALTEARNHACLLQFPENALHGPLGDSDRARDLPDPDIRISGDREQDVPVIAKESPGWGAWVNRHRHFPVSHYIKHKTRIDKQEKIIMLGVS